MTSPRKVLRVHVAAAAAVLACLSPGAGAAIDLAPRVAGSFGAGSGANATFAQIADDWHGSTVLWNPAEQRYGSGDPIGSFSWGTGLWGRADWDAVQASLAGAAGPAIVASWSGTVGSINFADQRYNDDHSAAWGPAGLAPLFGTGAQDNWTSRFTGYLRITTPGIYEFSVLNDDGFFLRLHGAGDALIEGGRDFLNPRERNALPDAVSMGEGLYGFELGAWDRLEAGVVDLRWRRLGETDWTPVPADHLLAAVPEPSSTLLLALGLAALAASGARGGLRTRRDRRPRV